MISGPGEDRMTVVDEIAGASAAVALKAGFVEAGRGGRAPEAPAGTGTDVIRERRTDPH